MINLIEKDGPGKGWWGPPKGDHGSKKDLSTGVPASTSSVFTAYPTSMKNAASGLVDAKKEQVIIGDSIKNNVAYFNNSAGSNDSIKVGKDVWEYAAGRTMLHNHPKGHSPGFSPSDVLAAAKHGVGSMRVVQRGLDGIFYSFKISGGGGTKPWVNDMGKFRNRIEQISRNVIRDGVAMIDSGKISSAQASFNHWHSVWNKISGEFGLSYSRSIIKE